MIIQTTWAWAYAPSKFTQTPKYLVLHHAAASVASAADIHRWHLGNKWAGIGYHLYVRKDGSIYAGRPMDCQGAHCQGYNSRSVGVCFEGNFETESMGEKQLSAGVEALRYVLARYPGLKILGHRDLNATACPGKNFPLAYFQHYEDATTPTAGAATPQKEGHDNTFSPRGGEKEKSEDEDMDISKLTDEQCYSIIEKAQRYAAKLPLPTWAETEYTDAMEAGITDGTSPMQLMPRYQGALMSLRTLKREGDDGK